MAAWGLPAEASFGIVASTRVSILLKIRPLPRVFLNGTTSQEEVQLLSYPSNAGLTSSGVPWMIDGKISKNMVRKERFLPL